VAGASKKEQAGRIRVGVGGWTFEPWRANFYPEGLAQTKELEYASRQLTAIEINGTYYGSQKPASFAKWRDETPDDFMFSMKATRYATNRKILGEAGESIERFVKSGISELKHKLGPIVWQFASTKKFEPADFEAFLKLLPREVDGLPLRHALDVRHATFMTNEYLDMARRHDCATVFTDSDEYPSFADLTGDFVYARLMRTDANLKHGVAPKALDRWAEVVHLWAEGKEPDELPRVDKKPGPTQPRDVYAYFISGAKEKAPHAAMELIKRLK